MKDYDFINKIEDIVEKRRKANPLQQEYNRLVNEIYPIDTITNIYKLGYCDMLVNLKKNLSKYFCKDDQEVINEIIRLTRKESKEMDEMIGKLLI